MHAALTTFINRLETPTISETQVIRWGAPVPSFGDLSRATIATIGLNPSNLEFTDDSGIELQGLHRRFHTLKSLELKAWSFAASRHLQLILDSCRTYFLGNPYDRWFKRLDYILGGIDASYYGSGRTLACHLDLIPYATSRKWGELSSRQQGLLLALSADSLGLLLRHSPVRILILNGRGVVNQFQEATGFRLQKHETPSWTLRRLNRASISGAAYSGTLDSICGIRLSHQILILGYNHNIQSSFGVTREAVAAIRGWVAEAVKDYGEAARPTIS